MYFLCLTPSTPAIWAVYENRTNKLAYDRDKAWQILKISQELAGDLNGMLR